MFICKIKLGISKYPTVFALVSTQAGTQMLLEYLNVLQIKVNETLTVGCQFIFNLSILLSLDTFSTNDIFSCELQLICI